MSTAPAVIDPYKDQKAEVVTTLREVLEQAERGEVIGLAMAIVQPDSYTTVRVTTFSGHADCIGRLMLLVYKLSAAGWEDGP